MGERVLITGATGFVGSHLARYAAATGAEVHCVVRRPIDDPAVVALMGYGAVHHHDGTTERLIKLFLDARPNVVVHCAARFVADHRPNDVAPLIDDNLRFSAQLLEAMRQARVARLVFASTAWTHLDDAAYSPVNLYAATKEAFHALAQYYAEADGLSVASLEITDPYGPGDTRAKLMPALLAAEKSGAPISMVPRTHPIDLVHVDDVVKAMCHAATLLIAEKPGTMTRWAVRSGEPVTMEELLAIWATARGTALVAEWGARALRPRDMRTPWTSGTDLPGWTPAIALADGLKTL